MMSYPASRSFKPKGGGLTARAPKSCKYPDLQATNPKVKQFEPTPACPVNQHKQMAGD